MSFLELAALTCYQHSTSNNEMELLLTQYKQQSREAGPQDTSRKNEIWISQGRHFPSSAAADGVRRQLGRARQRPISLLRKCKIRLKTLTFSVRTRSGRDPVTDPLRSSRSWAHRESENSYASAAPKSTGTAGPSDISSKLSERTGIKCTTRQISSSCDRFHETTWIFFVDSADASGRSTVASNRTSD